MSDLYLQLDDAWDIVSHQHSLIRELREEISSLKEENSSLKHKLTILEHVRL